ncbi:MAG: hypothetical protein ABF391_11810, partial [Akkermansiaceae bacterium]
MNLLFQKMIPPKPTALTTSLVGDALAFVATFGLLPAMEVDVTFSGLAQDYDGSLKTPAVATDPPGVQVALDYFPRGQAEEVFRRIPVVDQPSYASYGLNGTNDRALGDVVDLGGVNRHLESVEVALVSWSRAANWPGLFAENGEGYFHPLTLTIFRVVGEDLFLLEQVTEEFLVPWRPATLDDGGEYPFGGKSFRARFDFSGDRVLSGKLALLISYNTGNGGFEPLGVTGPYDSLNVALSDLAVAVGSDDDPTRMVR